MLIIIILPFLLFWRWVFKGEVLFWGTLLFQFWPWRYLVKTTLLAGQWPLWNPLLGNGAPLLANLQAAAFYPPNLLYLILPVEHGLTLSVILHLALAGLFMYSYTRYIGLASFAATLSALTYMFSGYLVGRGQFVTMINAAAWLPLLLLLSEKIVTRRVGLDILWLGLVLAMQLLAGHAQLWFYTLWLIGAYTVFRSWQEANTLPDSDEQPTNKRQIQNLKSAGWRLGLAVGLAILLAAVQLLPTAELVSQSTRSGGAERTFALTYSFWPWRLVTLLAPNFFGHPAQGNYWGYANFWEDHAYLGVLPFLLALAAIWQYYQPILRRRPKIRNPKHLHLRCAPAQVPQGGSRAAQVFALQVSENRNRLVPFFATLIPISLVLAMGWYTPIYLWIFDTVPGFGYFQAPARLLIWYTAAMAILAGVGAQFFEVRPKSRLRWRRLLVACIGVTIAGLAGGVVLSGRSRTFLDATSTLGIWLTLSIIFLLAGPNSGTSARRTRYPSLWQSSVIVFVALDLLWATFPLIPTLPPAVFNQPVSSADFLKAQPGSYRFFVDDKFDYETKFNQYFRFDTFGPLETGYWQGLRQSLVPNLGVYAGLPSANNDDPLVVGPWQQLTTLLNNSGQSQRARLLGLMNVGYFVGGGDKTGWPAIYQEGGVTIRPVPGPLPRAYFVSQVYQAKDEAEVVARLTSPEFDPGQEVVIMNSGSGANAQASAGSAELVNRSNLGDRAIDGWPVAVNEQKPELVLLEVEAPTAGFVVLTDAFYPGWQATVNGQPAQIWPANLAFRAVAVEAGAHEIMFNYRPRSFAIGLWISIVTLLVVVVTGGLSIKNSRRKRS